MAHANDHEVFYIDSFDDYRGVTITLCWSKKLWVNHVTKHPEIRNHSHTSRLIKEVLSEPSLVVTGHRPGDSGEKVICYYKEHKRSQGDVYITKVVVGYRGSKLYIKTVFQEWVLWSVAIQEKKYGFKELYRDKKTYL